MEGARLDLAHTRLPEPSVKLLPSLAVERGAQHSLGRHPTAQQLTHALDEHRGLPAARRSDDLDHAVACLHRPPLSGVEASAVLGAVRSAEADGGCSPDIRDTR